MLLNRIIFLNGHMGSGKDTLGAYMGQDYGFKTLSLADPMYDMAYFLRNILLDENKSQNMRGLNNLVSLMFSDKDNKYDARNIIEELLEIAEETDLVNQNPKKPRKFLQAVGMYLREKKTDILVEFLLKRIEIYSLNTLLTKRYDFNEFRFVVTDLRTEEEIESFNKITPEKLFYCDNKLLFIHIEVSMDTIIKRLSLRDGVDEKSVLKQIKHKTEAKISKKKFNYRIDGNQDFARVVNQIDKILIQENIT